MTEPRAEQRFQGIGVSGGTVIGPIHVLREVETARRSRSSAAEELQLFRDAVASAHAQIAALISDEDELAGEILEFQLALLEDDGFLNPVADAIGQGKPADEAWTNFVDGEVEEYRSGGSDVLAARAADLIDLKSRVLHVMRGTANALGEIPAGAILVASELTPSAFLGLDWSRIGGATTLGGSPTSHVAILARARNVNLVVGLNAALDAFEDGAPAVLDAVAGRLIVSPGSGSLAAAEAQMKAAKQDEAAIADVLGVPARTARGEGVSVLVNIDDPALLNSASADSCDGVGLTRTEFLFKGGHLPGEDEQLAFYRRLLEWAAGRPVTIRTLDAGGDKPIPGVTIDGEANPFLGVRGLRLSLAQPDLFRVQLRALARAAAHGPVKVMFPMVTVPQEFDIARQMMLAEIADLQRSGRAAAIPPMGIMVEVPAAALTAEAFAVDFYSIGSNDLIQYVTACARDNSAVAPLADPLNPAVLEMIRRTVEAANSTGREVSLCGDMASTPAHIPHLLDLGLRSLSCAHAQIGPVKLAISRHGAPNHG